MNIGSVVYFWETAGKSWTGAPCLKLRSGKLVSRDEKGVCIEVETSGWLVSKELLYTNECFIYRREAVASIYERNKNETERFPHLDTCGKPAKYYFSY